VVEQAFAWLGRFRRLVKDYEYLPATLENAACLAMSVIPVRRMTRPAGGPGGSSRRAGTAARWAGSLFRHPLNRDFIADTDDH